MQLAMAPPCNTKGDPDCGLLTTMNLLTLSTFSSLSSHFYNELFKEYVSLNKDLYLILMI